MDRVEWKSPLALIDAWMRRYGGAEWLRDSQDGADLQGFLVERYGFSTDLMDAISRLRPEPFVEERLGVPLKINDHAMERFRGLTKCKRSERHVLARLRRILETSEEVQLKPEHRAKQLIHHHFAPARYFRTPKGWIFVIEESGLLRTVHNGEAGKWQSK